MTTATALLGPTRERLGKCGDFDIPITDAKRRRQAFRIVGVVETMWRAGSLPDRSMTAFKAFEKDLSIAHGSRGLLSRYGDDVTGIGTPLTQQVSDLLAAEHRSEAHRSLAGALKAIGEPRTVETLLALATKDVKLEDIGRAILLIGNRQQAVAAARRTVQCGTYNLAEHYGTADERINPG